MTDFHVDGLATGGRHLRAVEDRTVYEGKVPVMSGRIVGHASGGTGLMMVEGSVQPWSFASNLDLTADQCWELVALFTGMARACDQHEDKADLDGDA